MTGLRCSNSCVELPLTRETVLSSSRIQTIANTDFVERRVFSCWTCSYVTRLTLPRKLDSYKLSSPQNGDTFNDGAFKCCRLLNDSAVPVDKGSNLFLELECFYDLEKKEYIFLPLVIGSRVISLHQVRSPLFVYKANNRNECDWCDATFFIASFYLS